MGTDTQKAIWRSQKAIWRAANSEKSRTYEAQYSAANPDVARGNRARWNAANPTKRRVIKVREWFVYRLKRFQITESAYLALVALQGNRCAICLGEFIETPHIDHDHKCCPRSSRSCGSCIRGLLCLNCNMGRYPENPEILRRAADYFEANCWVGD